MDPIDGAQKEGTLGFFKGLGSGSLDLLVRSTAGNTFIHHNLRLRIVGLACIHVKRSTTSK